MVCDCSKEVSDLKDALQHVWDTASQAALAEYNTSAAVIVSFDPP